MLHVLFIIFAPGLPLSRGRLQAASLPRDSCAREVVLHVLGLLCVPAGMQCSLHNTGRTEKERLRVAPPHYAPKSEKETMIAAVRTRGKKEAEMRVVHAAP